VKQVVYIKAHYLGDASPTCIISASCLQAAGSIPDEVIAFLAALWR
jgi:hypothetical protein